MTKKKEVKDDLKRVKPKHPKQELNVIIPLAVSVNHLYMFKRGKRFMTKKGEKYMKDVNEKIKKEYALTFGFSVKHSRCDNKLELVITHVCLYEDNQIKKVVPFSLWLFD